MFDHGIEIGHNLNTKDERIRFLTISESMSTRMQQSSMTSKPSIFPAIDNFIGLSHHELKCSAMLGIFLCRMTRVGILREDFQDHGLLH